MFSKISFFLLISFSIVFASQDGKQPESDSPPTLAPVKTRCGGRSPFQANNPLGTLFPGLGSGTGGVDQGTLTNLLAQQQQLMQSVLQLLQRFQQGGSQQGFAPSNGFQQPFPNNNALPPNTGFQQPFPSNNALPPNTGFQQPLPSNTGFQTNPNNPTGQVNPNPTGTNPNPNPVATGQNQPSAFGTGQTGNPTGTNTGFNPNNQFPNNG